MWAFTALREHGVDKHERGSSGQLLRVPGRREKRVPGTALLARKDEGAAPLVRVLVHSRRN